jgi:6-phosphogluconolactonase
VIVDRVAALTALVVQRFEACGTAAGARRGFFACALPGGSVAETILPHLATAGLDWPRVHIFWVDERAVPPVHADSNFGSGRDWLDRLPAPGPQVHRIEAEVGDLEAAAARYASTLATLLGQPPRLDFVLLGVGADGHVASLFPDHPALQETSRWVTAILDAPKPPPRRVSLTLPALAAASEIAVVALGTSKAEPIRSALHDPEPGQPLGRLIRAAGDRVTLFLDPAAAGL